MTSTLSEEAVKALNTFSFYAQQWGWQSDQGYNQREIDETKANFDASYAVLEKLLAVSRPSAAREQALEEAAQFIESHIYTSSPDGVRLVPSKRAGLDLHHQTIAAAIRAISSPDHADAGKVEGDGWKPIESAPKDGTVIDLWSAEFGRQPDCYWGKRSHCCGEDGQYCDSDWHSEPEAWIDSAENTETFDDITHWRPLPSAPSEGAK